MKGEEEKVLDKEEEGEGVETEVFGRATDPVRMYLREMGTVSLLTREGEVEIAKRIESGKKEMLGIVLSCPMAVREIIQLGNAIKAGKVEIREVSNELDEEEPSVEEEQAQQKKILERVDRIQRMDEGIRKVLKNKGLSPGRIQEQVRKKQREIVDCFSEMNVRDSQVNKIVQKMKQVLARVEKAENEVRKIEGRWRTSVHEARVFLKRLKARTLSEKTLLQSRNVGKADLLEIDGAVKVVQRKIRAIGIRVRSSCRSAEGRRKGDCGGGDSGQGCEERTGEGEPEVGRFDCKEIHQPGASVPRPDSGGKYRLNEGGREI